MRRRLGQLLKWAAVGVFILAAIRGWMFAIPFFFTIQTCAGSNCVWVFHGWNPVVWALLFLFVYLPLSPLVALWAAWPWLLVGALVRWAADRLSPAVA
ncbi:MAG: hypothetical protein ACRDI2_24870 [Chloroflexota bacterium]